MAEPLLDLRVSTELTGRAEFSELLMLLNYARRATFLFALYNTAGAREELTAAIKQTIAPTPVFTWTYSPEEPYPVSYLKHLTEEQQRERAVVFFFDLERGDEKAWKSLDHTREHLARHPHTLIFWVTPKGRVDAANKAPHFWAQRSLVFDFTIAQPERQAELRGQWAGSDLWIENFEDAEQQLRLFRGLLDEYRELSDAPPTMLAELNGKVARLLNFLDRREEALPFLEEQLALARQLGNQDLEAEALINLAQVESIRTGQGAAIALLEQARPLNPSPQTRARVLENLAPHLVYEGRADESLVLLNQALALFQQAGAKLGQANVLTSIGDVQSFRDDKDAALASYDQALGLFQLVGDKFSQASVLKAIGDVQSFRDDKDAALASYNQALSLFQLVGAKLGQANVRLSKGIMNGDAAEFEAAIRLYEEIGDTYSIARGKYYYGSMLINTGETERGAQLLREARAGWARINYAPGVEMIDESLAELDE
jgi:tetratricopeptide (TPR) repeat protein